MTPDNPYLIPELMLLLLTIGGVGGFLSGLLGVGGGILFVPALFFSLSALGFEGDYVMHLAIGSSLAIVLATGAASAFAHYRRGSVDVPTVRRWAPYIVGGVILGSLFASVVEGHMLQIIFAVVTFAISIYMAFGHERPETAAPNRFLTEKVQKALCAVIGTVSAMIGVGGAILTVPLMTRLGINMTRAAGTGSALVMFISVPGMLGYMLTGLPFMEELPPYSVGYVNFLAVALIIPAAILLAPLGVQASHTLPRRMLRRVFAVMLIIVSVRMCLSL